MSSMVPPPGYGSYGDGSGLYGPGGYGAGLYGSSLYGSPIYGSSLYGIGSPLFVYGMPLYRPYGSYYPTYVYRGLSTSPGRTGYGYGPARSIGTVRPGVGIGMGHAAVGGVHAGGHH
jgi:hypothetical protein